MPLLRKSLQTAVAPTILVQQLLMYIYCTTSWFESYDNQKLLAHPRAGYAAVALRSRAATNAVAVIFDGVMAVKLYERIRQYVGGFVFSCESELM